MESFLLVALTSGGLAGDDGLVADLVGPQLGEEPPPLLVVHRRLLRGNCKEKEVCIDRDRVWEESLGWR